MDVVFEHTGPHRRPRKLLAWLLLLGGTGMGLAALVGVILYGVFAQDLPEFDAISDYRPPVVTRVYDQTGHVIGEFFREHRTVVAYEDIPPKLVQAFLASEDDRFFEHGGIDYFGILRAAIANIKAGRVVQGGSTITQQVAKALLVSEEGYREGTKKKLSRKIKEAILAQRLERRLRKEDILSMYLNHIFLGNQAYGVHSAAQHYFRKNIHNLNIAEMALLGGLPQAPSRYSPILHPERARKRREYVLRRMQEEGFITEAELQEAKETPITVHLAPQLARSETPYFTEHVRRDLVARFGEKAVLEGGLQVYTTVDAERYWAAEHAAFVNLRQVDKRQGYRGPLKRLKSRAERDAFAERYESFLVKTDSEMAPGRRVLAVVDAVDRGARRLNVRIGQRKAVLPLAAMRWARKVNPQEWYERALLTEIPRSIRVGDVLLVQITSRDRLKKSRRAAPYLSTVPRRGLVVALEQEPDLETSLLSVAHDSGYILAMIGGYAFPRSEFNRAMQACRQPGSSFKPITYAAALDLKEWTPAHVVLDAPVTYDDPEAQRRWKPQNFETRFEGEVTLRMALQRSMNVPAIRVLDAVGIKDAIGYAQRLGIESTLRPELGLALGASCVTMAELLRVYSVFNNQGRRVPAIAITRVVDRDGRVLLDQGYYRDPWASVDLQVKRTVQRALAPPEKVIDPKVAFLITKMMRNVVEGGTGVGAKRLGVPAAGKTGTTNDSFDAWFVGFTQNIVTAAWVGYDDYVTPMGRYEQGGRAALPLWLRYMKHAVKRKTGEFAPPPGIVFVHIDPKTGQRRPPGQGVREAFIEGTEPEAGPGGEPALDDPLLLLGN